MNYTEKLKLRKPEGGEYYSVEDFNGNADLIDAAITGKINKPAEYVAGNFAAVSASGNIEDSGRKSTDFATSAHNHDAAYAPIPHVSDKAVHVNVEEKAAIAEIKNKANINPNVTALTPLNGFNTSENYVCRLFDCGGTKLINAELKYSADVSGGTVVMNTGIKGVYCPIIASVFDYSDGEFLGQVVLWHYTDGRLTVFQSLPYNPAKGSYNVLQINSTIAKIDIG